MSKQRKDNHMVNEWIYQWNNGHMNQFQVNHPHIKLEEHYNKYIQGKKRAKIVFPLCGDSFDMFSLADKGHEIVGIECSELAIKTFFSRHNLGFSQKSCDDVKGVVFKSLDNSIRIYCCNIFDFKPHVEGKFDVIIDFGSMGALQKEDLQMYVDLMKQLMGDNCRHVLECFVYDTLKHPDCQPNCFSIDELQAYFGKEFSVEKIDEGPNPYDDGDIFTSDLISQQELSMYPQITGTAYFLIKPI